MGITERREREKEEIKKKILDAARELFTTEGYARVTIRRIAEAIEYSPTTIYHHFEDKDDLVRALCHADFGGLLEAMQLAPAPADPVEAIRQLGRAYVAFALRNPNSATHPAGIFYGQLMAGPITKWEEDGLFYVIWPAFLYWTQSGDNSLVRGEYLKTMEDAMDWLERYSFDPRQGLFGRYYYGESMLTGSRDDGFDSAEPLNDEIA